MTTVTMLELRKDPLKIIRQAQAGKSMVLTYRGKPVMRLTPVAESPIPEEDAFYRLPEIAMREGGNLSNREMDEAIYGR